MFKLNELFRLVDTKVIFYFGLTKATGTQKTIINVKYSFFLTLTHILYTYLHNKKHRHTFIQHKKITFAKYFNTQKNISKKQNEEKI